MIILFAILAPVTWFLVILMYIKSSRARKIEQANLQVRFNDLMGNPWRGFTEELNKLNNRHTP